MRGHLLIRRLLLLRPVALRLHLQLSLQQLRRPAQVRLQVQAQAQVLRWCLGWGWAWAWEVLGRLGMLTGKAMEGATATRLLATAMGTATVVTQLLATHLQLIRWGPTATATATVTATLQLMLLPRLRAAAVRLREQQPLTQGLRLLRLLLQQ